MKKCYQLYIARNEAGHSYQTAGDFIGISKSAYHQKENGVNEFKLSEAFKLAEIYGINIEELFPEIPLIFKKGVTNR